VFEILTTQNSVLTVAMKYFIDSSSLWRLINQFYQAWMEQRSPYSAEKPRKKGKKKEPGLAVVTKKKT